MDIEKYIRDLAPELQERARACSSVGELLALARETKAPLPDEALSAIAGGDVDESGCGGSSCTCPRCLCEEVKEWFTHDRHYFRCRKCGLEWYEKY